MGSSCSPFSRMSTAFIALSGVPPTDGTPDHYEVRFTAPGAGPNTAKLGKADSVFTNSLQRITDIARARWQQPPESESADRAEWRGLQLVDAHSDCGRDPEHAERPAAVRHCRQLASTTRPNRARSRRRAAITVSTSTSRILPAPAAAASSSR